MNEEVLDEETWKVEAQAVINDIKGHLKSAELSQVLNSNNQKIYFNLTTLEGGNYCIELSGRGFRMVGQAHDSLEAEESPYFETPYSLLNQISSEFHKSFGYALMEKLAALSQD